MKKTSDEIEKILESMDFSRGRAQAVWRKVRPHLNVIDGASCVGESFAGEAPLADELIFDEVCPKTIDRAPVDGRRVDELSFGELDEVAGGSRKPEEDNGTKDKK